MKLIINNLKQYLKSSKAVFLFNIAGFTVAFTAFLVIVIQVNYDFGYNRHFTKSGEIYRFKRYNHGNGDAYRTINQDWARDMQAKIPEVKAYCLLLPERTEEIATETDGVRREYVIPLMEATPGFFDVFTPETVSGSVEKIFDADGKALISEKTAEKLFGKTDPLGQILHRGNSTLTVAAVYKDFPENCSLANGIYTYMQPNRPENWNYLGYFLIDPGNLQTVTEKINSVDFLGEEMFSYLNKSPEERIELQLPALRSLYLYADNMRIHTTLSLLGIGIILLLIAFINFTNFAISMAPARIKNVNIHKIFGIDALRLRLAIAAEAVLFTLFGLAVSLVCLYFFKGSSLAANFVADLSLTANRQLIAVAALTVTAISALIGLYPAVYITSFGEAFAMKGSFTLSPKGVILRNGLIVFQFAASIALICISGMIKLQNDYMQHYSWGFQRENIASVNLSNTGIDAELFGEELKGNASVTDYTLSWNLPGRVGMSWERNFEGKSTNFFTVWPVTPNFLDFFGVKVVAGSDFPKERDREKIIFNQEFMKANGFTEDIIGKEFMGFSPADITGVVENIHFESLHEPIKPMAFVVFPGKGNYNFLFLKLSGSNLPANIAQVERTWKKFTDKPFDLKFLDDSMNELYRNEINTGNLISVFGLISVIIAMMGVYGLVLFNTRYRTKEIAIRKINGATEREVLHLLNRNMLRLLLIAFLIAIPAVQLFISGWMERFAYKVPYPWWLYPISGILVLLIAIATVSWQSYKAAAANPVNSLKME